MRKVRQQANRKTGAKRGPPVDCTVKTGCRAMIISGVVQAYGQLCRNESRKSGRDKKYLSSAKPGRESVSLDGSGRGAEKKCQK